MLLIDKEGMVVNPRVHAARATSIERGQMKLVSGIIVHQTGGSTAQSSLSSYKNPSANGAHFLIEKDGTIYQTASLSQQTWHVGKLKARCLLENRCTPVEIKALKTFSPTAENKREIAKQAPARFPANQDSIGIELVGEAQANGSYVAVTAAQNDSLKWLVAELSQTLGIAPTEVFRHPDVSRKNPTEASTAAW
ncbi:hypothetical protein GCM10007907_11730 [Chitinimonas prasina]|uniref:N-acetylmuramoyl-L-alanine amidase n=1 Tax=Chitinimonas prasina TaxID=1434937 RepID=A0ABQ5YFF3_9NEIS|nr:peptidoglycan recognition family protein [Chitinimonas prasina]GLR12383.1 hypothetical protein GCM10007907_11730 [Chitinimonas prasina]